ncbi:MAG: hypothetical protein LBG82_03420, partial [Clostridiales Family XIII bacterium]|nr:hypothetical protein [Clostridiales Family XIII bacterium]
MIISNNMPRKIISAAVCAAMLLSLLALSPQPAEASTPTTKEINVDGIGTVTYATVNESTLHEEDGEWYHATIDGKDYRKLASRTNVVFYAENYPALPDRNAQNNPVEKSGGLGFKLYGVSEMTFYEFWKNEGLTASTVTDSSSTVKDPEGYNDLGGFDAVSRSTLSYGIGHTAYAYKTTIYGYDKAKYDAGELVPTGPFTPIFRAKSMGANGAVGSASASYETIGFPTYKKGVDSTQSPSGHASAETFFVDEGAGEVEHVIDRYDVTGPANVPVSVEAVDYVENMILADMRQDVPSAFKNIRVGEKLPNIVDENDATGATMQDIEVGADTGLLKHINKNGEYGKAAAGKDETTYTLTSNGFLDAEGKPTYGTGFNTSWGDYFDAYIFFQPKTSDKTTSDVNGQQYFNYINNFIGAKYEYYGDVRDIAGVNEPSDITSIA